MIEKLIFLTLLVLSVFFNSCTSTPDETVKPQIINGSFEKGLTYWSEQSWSPKSKITVTRTDSKHGSISVVIESLAKANDVRLIQPLIVEQDTSYRISGWIKVKNVKLDEHFRPFGAHFAIEDLQKTELIGNTPPLTGTTDWTYVTCDFNTGKRNFIKIEVCLGTYNGVCTGKAWFDDIKIVEN